MTGNILRYRLYKLYSCLAYATPLGILFAVNSKAYISTPSRGISFFGYIIIVFIAIGFKSKIQEFAKKNTILTISAIAFIVALIMQYLAMQLLLISAVSMGGCVLSAIVEPVADVYYNRCYKHATPERRERVHEPTLLAKDAWKIAYGFRYE